MSNYAYNASPETSDNPVYVPELEQLLQSSGKNFVKDTRKVLHFIRRVQVTMLAYREQINSLNQQLQKVSLQADRAGQPNTMSPLDAIKYIPPAQLASLVERHSQEKLLQAEKHLNEAIKTKQTSLVEINRIRYSVTTLLENPQIPLNAKEQFKKLMRELPSEKVEEVKTSAAIKEEITKETELSNADENSVLEDENDLTGLFS